MNRFFTERPRFEDMRKAELIALLDRFRAQLRNCEDAADFCRAVAEVLCVDVRAGAYD